MSKQIESAKKQDICKSSESSELREGMEGLVSQSKLHHSSKMVDGVAAWACTAAAESHVRVLVVGDGRADLWTRRDGFQVEKGIRFLVRFRLLLQSWRIRLYSGDELQTKTLAKATSEALRRRNRMYFTCWSVTFFQSAPSRYWGRRHRAEKKTYKQGATEVKASQNIQGGI